MENNNVIVAWREAIEAGGVILSSVITKREDIFLEFGQKLHEVSSASKDLAVKAGELTALTGGEDLSATREKLHADFQKIVEFCKTEWGEESVAILHELRTALQDLQQGMRDFRRIVRTLGVLSFTTRVESSRLGESGRGFLTLADDVEKLAQKIVEHWKQIGEKTDHLQEMVLAAREKVAALVQEQKHNLGKMLATMTSNMKRLEDLQNQSQQASEALASKVSDIKEDVSRVVSSIQFHDITRQAVEHVQTTLKEVVDQIDLFHSGAEQDANEAQMAGWMNKVCKLQVAQVEYVSQSFGTAVDELGEGLLSISRAISSMTDELKASLGSNDDQSKGVIWEIQAGIQEVEASVQSFAKEGKLIGRVMEEVRQTVSEMSSFAEDIEEIGSEIELIALNASVRAARTGEEGMALGVVAVAIQQLSGNAREQSRNTTTHLDIIAEQATKLNLLSSQSMDMDQLAALSEKMKESMDRLSKTDVQVAQGLEQIRANTLELSSDVNQIMTKISFKDLVVRDLDEAVSHLQSVISGTASHLSEDVNDIVWPDRLASLINRYTMESQRVNHRMQFEEDQQDETEPREEDVVLFDAEETGEFGDNVELF